MADGANIGQDYKFLGELYEVTCKELSRPLTTPDGSVSISPWIARNMYDMLLWKMYTGSNECNPDAPFNDCSSPTPVCTQACTASSSSSSSASSGSSSSSGG